MAYTAHDEWALRPPDERYASVHALYDAARARHARIEERTTETGIRPFIEVFGWRAVWDYFRKCLISTV
jgi:acyl-CoA reductase-like NAD-dependent aldehyde dehydrogenase